MRRSFIILTSDDVVTPVVPPVITVADTAILHLTAIAAIQSSTPSPLPASIIECFTGVVSVVDVRITIIGGR